MEIPDRELASARAVLIAGPTASGKSQFALAVAERAAHLGRRPVVINADSQQVYAGLAILTARPGADDMARAPHRLYGHVAPQERYSVGRWRKEAAALLDRAGPEELAIFVGGTGLYFDVLLHGLADIPDVPPDVQLTLRERLASEGPERLHTELTALDPEAASGIEPRDPQRILRALGVLQASGRRLSSWQGQWQRPLLPRHQSVTRVVETPRPQLYQRIEARLDAMVAKGALDEVAALVALGLDPDLPVMKAIGVAELADVLSGRAELWIRLRDAKTRSRRYAKRQLTWIRNRMADWPRIVLEDAR